MLLNETENILFFKPHHFPLSLLPDSRAGNPNAWQHPGAGRLVNPRKRAFEHPFDFVGCEEVHTMLTLSTFPL